MKKMLGIVMGAIIVSMSGAAFAEEAPMNFGQMLPMMQEMHPGLSINQLEDLYKQHHNTGGSEASVHFGMMECDVAE